MTSEEMSPPSTHTGKIMRVKHPFQFVTEKQVEFRYDVGQTVEKHPEMTDGAWEAFECAGFLEPID